MSLSRSEIKTELLKNKDGLKTGNLTDKEIQLFLELGDNYLSVDYHEYYKSAAIYQYVKKVLENKIESSEISSDDKRIQIVKDKIENTEKQFLLSVKKEKNEIVSIEPQKEKLESLRKEVKERLKNLKDEGIKRAETVKKIYEDIREKLIGNDGVATNLIKNCIEQLGGVPLVKGKEVDIVLLEWDQCH